MVQQLHNDACLAERRLLHAVASRPVVRDTSPVGSMIGGSRRAKRDLYDEEMWPPGGSSEIFPIYKNTISAFSLTSQNNVYTYRKHFLLVSQSMHSDIIMLISPVSIISSCGRPLTRRMLLIRCWRVSGGICFATTWSVYEARALYYRMSYTLV